MSKLKSPKRKGDYNERLAVKELNKFLAGSGLVAVRVPGSGAFSHRLDNCYDPHYAGDVQIRREADQHIFTTVEVKARGKHINIADMDGWRKGRVSLMARQDRGPFLCSAWAHYWDSLNAMRADGEMPFNETEGKTRGVRLADVHRSIEYGLPIRWENVFYMTTGQFAELLISSYGTFC